MGLTIHGFIEGDPEKFVAPYDKDKSFCGHDGLEDYPYLYIPDLNSGLNAKDVLNSGICVSECPDPEKPYGQ